jgi:hypothetical protein
MEAIGKWRRVVRVEAFIVPLNQGSRPCDQVLTEAQLAAADTKFN